MDIQTKDGILLRGIPDGTPDEVIKARIEKIRAESAAPSMTPTAPRKPLGPPEELTFAEKIATGVPAVAKRVASYVPAARLLAPYIPDADPASESRLRGFMLGAADPSVKVAQIVANAVGRGESINKSVQQKEQEYQSGRTGSGRDGFDWMRLGGNAMMMAMPASRVAPAATLPGRIAQASALGGGAGVLSPVTNGGENFWSDTAKGGLSGALIGPAAMPLAWAGKKLYNVGSDLAAGPVGQAKSYLAEVFADQAARADSKLSPMQKVLSDQIARRMAARQVGALRPNVAGEVPTAGLAAVTEGRPPIPALKALEEGARSRPFASQELANIHAKINPAARAAPLERIAAPGVRPPTTQGQPQKPSPAMAARTAATQPKYDALQNEAHQVDETLKTILSGAEIQPALKASGISLDQAATNAAVAGQAVPRGFTPGSVRPGMDLPEWSVAGPRTPDVVKPAEVTIGALKRLRDEIGRDLKNGMPADEAGRTKYFQLTTARKQLDTWMRQKSRGWEEVQNLYRDLSAPQNQADVAEVLLSKLRSPVETERGAMFAAAKQDAPRTIKAAGDVPRFQELRQVFTPAQADVTDAIERSVVRQGQYANLRAPQSILPGMKSAQGSAEKMTSPFVDWRVAVVRKALSTSGEFRSAQAQAIIDRMIARPQEMAAFMRQVAPSERQAIVDAIIDRMRPAVIAPMINQGANNGT